MKLKNTLGLAGAVVSTALLTYVLTIHSISKKYDDIKSQSTVDTVSSLDTLNDALCDEDSIDNIANQNQDVKKSDSKKSRVTEIRVIFTKDKEKERRNREALEKHQAFLDSMINKLEKELEVPVEEKRTFIPTFSSIEGNTMRYDFTNPGISSIHFSYDGKNLPGYIVKGVANGGSNRASEYTRFRLHDELLNDSKLSPVKFTAYCDNDSGETSAVDTFYAFNDMISKTPFSDSLVKIINIENSESFKEKSVDTKEKKPLVPKFSKIDDGCVLYDFTIPNVSSTNFSYDGKNIEGRVVELSDDSNYENNSRQSKFKVPRKILRDSKRNPVQFTVYCENEYGNTSLLDTLYAFKKEISTKPFSVD